MAASPFCAVFFIIGVLVIPRGIDCLSCYKCTSSVSWEDCNSKMTKTECPSGAPNCVKTKLTCSAGDVTKTVFYKRCGAQGKDCDTTRADIPSCPTSQFSWSVNYASTCCTGNNCNSGSSFKISSALTGMCIVLVLWGVVY